MTLETRNNQIKILSKKLAKRLIEQNKTLSVAESCTGGWLSKVLTDLPGSSEWFLGGVVSYSAAAKVGLLNVDKLSVDEHGVVSALIAQQMAKGASDAFSSSVSLSITGIAGPGGGTPELPMGSVWFGLKEEAKKPFSVKKGFKGNREEVRQQAVLTAIELLLEILKD